MPPVELIDLLSDGIEEVLYKSKHGPLLKKLAGQTNWSVAEVERIAMIHRKIEKTRGRCSRSVFRDVAHSGMDFTENIRHLLVDRIFSQMDKRNILKLTNDAFITGLSTILRGNSREQTNFAYQVYDMMRTNKLTKEQIFPLLRGCLIKMPSDENPDESVRDMVDLLVKAVDLDRDGDVSLEEFREAVFKKNLLFMECMGPVYPSREARHALLSTILGDLPNF